jgi:hypothetical protein
MLKNIVLAILGLRSADFGHRLAVSHRLHQFECEPKQHSRLHHVQLRTFRNLRSVRSQTSCISYVFLHDFDDHNSGGHGFGR